MVRNPRDTRQRRLDASTARLSSQAAKVVRACCAVLQSAQLVAIGTYSIDPKAMMALRAAMAEYERRADTSHNVRTGGGEEQ